MFAYVSGLKKPHHIVVLLATAVLLPLVLASVWLNLAFAPKANVALSQLRFGDVPLYFEPNVGQSAREVRFMARSGGGALFFKEGGVTVVLPSPAEAAPPSNEKPPTANSNVLSMEFVGANPEHTITPRTESSARVNYLLGNDPSRWHKGISTYAQIEYTSLYAGIDLLYEGAGGHLKGSYTVASGADPSRIRWRYSGVQSVSIESTGDLQIATNHSAPSAGHLILTEEAPIAWQEKEGQRTQVRVRYLIHPDGSIGFVLGEYDRALPLIIDPELTYRNYFGGTGANNNDFGQDIAVDSQGNTYIVGWTTAPNFPLVNPFQATLRGINDVIVAKWSPNGSQLLYSTYLGGSGQERGLGIAIDSAGNAYVTGRTESTDFPTRNPFQPLSRGGSEVFVAKLNASGSDLIYSTYLGGTPRQGSTSDIGEDIVVDANGNAYVSGYTGALDFPIANAIQPTYGGGDSDAFVAKLNSSGSALVFSTFLGGGAGNHGSDAASGVALDPAGNIYIAGTTTSNDFPTVNAIQPMHRGGESEAFVTKLNASGSAFVYSTYLGGADFFGDTASGIVADAEGNAYVTGQASAEDFPTANALQPNLNGTTDAFIAKLNPTGSAFLFSTFFGGSANGFAEYASSIAIDGLGNVYITGLAPSTDFPQVNPLPPGPNGSAGIFLAKFNAAGTALVYSTYLPRASNFGSHESSGLTVDGTGAAYLTGYAFISSETQGFVMKVSDGVIATPTATTTRTPTVISTSTGTPAPAGVIVGHVTWQGISQPNSRNEGITATLSLCVAGLPQNYSVMTDASGYFTITTGLVDGTYNWRIKGPRNLGNAGTLILVGGSASEELGLLKAGDSNDNDLVNTTDFNILRVAFGSTSDLRADYNRDGIVTSLDFNLLRGNFGQGGTVLTCP